MSGKAHPFAFLVNTRREKLKPSTGPFRNSQPIPYTEKMSSASNPASSLEPTAAPCRIVLTGFMGSGKSTVGPLLAERLGWRFADADEAIEAEAGYSIPEIFRREGESGFRQREFEAIARLLKEKKIILSLGGGAIETEITRDLLLSEPETLLVHLEVELETTLARCRGTEAERPILADHANLQARYLRRMPLYRQAHRSITVDQLTPEEVVEAITKALAH